MTKTQWFMRALDALTETNLPDGALTGEPWPVLMPDATCVGHVKFVWARDEGTIIGIFTPVGVKEQFGTLPNGSPFWSMPYLATARRAAVGGWVVTLAGEETPLTPQEAAEILGLL